MPTYTPYYVLAVLGGLSLAVIGYTQDKRSVDEFFGFAETEETEINFNYPVEINEIRVQPGQLVEAGDTLLVVSRARPKESLPIEDFKIEELNAKDRLALERTNNELADLDLAEAAELADLQREFDEVSAEARYRESLLAGLRQNVGPKDASLEGGNYDPLAEEADAIKRQMKRLRAQYEDRRRHLTNERDLARAPYRSEVKRLSAEREFNVSNAEQTFAILAPGRGVIGSVGVKLAEHKNSFAPLLNFYEPNPSLVKAYIHEDHLLLAQLGDSVIVSSVGNPDVHQRGAISGLGSRIIEIPARLRKMPDFKTYGREVVIRVPDNNDLIQHEKVKLTFTEPRDES